VSAVDRDVEREPGEVDAFVPPITVSTQSKTIDANGDVASGSLRVNDGKSLERGEAENVDQHQFGVDSPLGSQDPAETPRGNAQDCIEHQGAHPMIILEPDMQHGESVRQPPAASQPAEVPERVENTKPMKSPQLFSDRLTIDARRVNSGPRSRLQAEVEGDEEDNEVIDVPRDVSDSNGPPLFHPLGRMLSLLDEAGPPRSAGGLGRTLTRRPRRPIGRRRSSKLIQTQPPAEVESGWQSEGTSNVNPRSGTRITKSDDLSFFAGL